MGSISQFYLDLEEDKVYFLSSDNSDNMPYCDVALMLVRGSPYLSITRSMSKAPFKDHLIEKRMKPISISEALHYLNYKVEVKESPEVESEDAGTHKKQVWEESFDDIPWEEFDETYFWCDKCKSYQEGQCLCYTR